MLQAVLKDNLRLWEECLPHIEFAYNRSIHSTTKLSPFMVVYGFNPRAPIDLLPLPTSEIVNFDATQCSEFILKLHERTKLQIEKMNEKYRIAANKGRKEMKLEPGDLVWVHLRKDMFLDLRSLNLCHELLVLIKFLQKLMIMHIHLSCL
jgi:translation initiation factor IF-1